MGIQGYRDVSRSENALLSAVNLGPVSVLVQADQKVFQLYQDGVLTSRACGHNLDHAITCIGYGTTDGGVDYWRVRNSWGPSWGESGYIRFGRGISSDGECGILDRAS